MKYQYLNLKIGARFRLAVLRSNAEARPNKTWRDVRYDTFLSGSDLNHGTNSGNPIWYTQRGQFFKHEEWCDEVEGVRIDHTGWYTDDECGEKTRGIVAKLPHNRWLAGYWMSMNDERVYFPTIYDDPKDAARAADQEAERIAEDEREHNERYREAQDLSDEIEELEKRIKELFLLRHKVDYAQDELPDQIEKLREKREKLATNYKGIL